MIVTEGPLTVQNISQSLAVIACVVSLYTMNVKTGDAKMQYGFWAVFLAVVIGWFN